MVDRERFGQTLRTARFRAGFSRIFDFASYLQDVGIHYSQSAVQSWETGNRIPERAVLLAICESLAKMGGFEQLVPIQQMLEDAGYPGLTGEERQRQFAVLEDLEPFSAQMPPRPDYRTLVGRRTLIAELVSALTDSSGKPLIVISGLGGIGKTALAYEVIREALRHSAFEGVIWAIAKQEEFVGVSTQPLANPATVQAVLAQLVTALGMPERANLPISSLQALLKSALAQRNMLIYVDNLETLAAHDFARILYELVRDNRRSRILLTSRESLAELPYTQDSAVSGLEKADALQLLMDEARDRKAQALLMCKEDTLNRIYAVTQGMPLAIKLIVTQSLLAIPVEEELQRLQATTPEADFYHFLYAAVWEKLPEDARTLLIALAGYPGWTLRSMLQPVADLDDAAFIRATADLIRASLIEHSYHQRTSQQLYDLHAMTRWFVNGPLTDQWS